MPVIAVLVIYALVWTAIGVATHPVIHHDMAEAWAWGKEFQAGYFKHPPLFAWIAGAWFEVLPRTNASFYLLSSVNAAVGLGGVYLIARRLLDQRPATTALLLVMLTPFFNLFAMKFNANSVLLSIWPWTVYFFLRALDVSGADVAGRGAATAWRGRVLDAMLFGALAGLAMLGKYFSAVLIVSCVAASLATPRMRAIYATPLPYVAAIAGLIVLSPHLAWVWTNGFPTVEYALDKTQSPRLGVLMRALSAVSQAVLFQGLALIALAVVFDGRLRGLPAQVSSRVRQGDFPALAILTLGPLALTLIACVAFNVRISVQFMIPVFFLIPITILALTAVSVTPIKLARIRSLALAFGALVIGVAVVSREFSAIAAPSATRLSHAAIDQHASLATETWYKVTRRRLDIVAGDVQSALLLAFYSADGPSTLFDFSFRKSPWIDDARLQENGMLVVCHGTRASCAAKYAALGPDQTWTQPGQAPARRGDASADIAGLWVQAIAPGHPALGLLPVLEASVSGRQTERLP